MQRAVAKKSTAHETKVTAGKKGMSVKDWAVKINKAWRKAAEAYLECGQSLLDAKKSLGHGEWLKLLTDESYLAFEERTAQRLMKIAKHPLLSKPTNLSLLPPNYTTLETLSRLPNDFLEKAFRKGDIHPNMDGSDAQELVEMAKPKKVEHSREADEAEVVEEEHEDHKPEPKPAKGNKEKAKSKQTTVVKGAGGLSGIEAAINNYGECIGTLREWCETLDEKMEEDVKGDGDGKLPQGIMTETKQVIALLQRIVKDYS